MPVNRAAVLVTKKRKVISPSNAFPATPQRATTKKHHAPPVRARHRGDRKKEFLQDLRPNRKVTSTGASSDLADSDSWQDEPPMLLFDLELESDFISGTRSKVNIFFNPLAHSLTLTHRRSTTSWMSGLAVATDICIPSSRANRPQMTASVLSARRTLVIG